MYGSSIIFNMTTICPEYFSIFDKYKKMTFVLKNEATSKLKDHCMRGRKSRKIMRLKFKSLKRTCSS